MRIVLATAALLSIAATQNTQGAVTGLTAAPGPIVGGFTFTVRGTNPCTSVHMDFGDGSSHTYPIAGLPDSSTIWHHYTRGGSYVIRATGAGGCRGEASTRVTVNLPITEPTPPPPPPPQPATPPSIAARFPGMDRNGDRIVAREEWQGSARSFSFHDWNRDGRLSGDEVRLGVTPPAGGLFMRGGIEWSEARFRALDRNGDGRVSRAEWRYDLEDFYRVDRDRNDALTREEFLVSQIDDDRGDHFEDLDLNRDNRLERHEWHGSEEIYRWLDQNADAVLSRVEVVGPAAGKSQPPVLTKPGADTSGRTFDVSAREAWTDTGIDVRAGDVLQIRATGTISWAAEPGATAPPEGAKGPSAPTAPVPRQRNGALVGRIGDGPAFLAMGDGGTIRARQAGRLFLGINDDVLTDNSGAFRVTVSVKR